MEIWKKILKCIFFSRGELTCPFRGVVGLQVFRDYNLLLWPHRKISDLSVMTYSNLAPDGRWRHCLLDYKPNSSVLYITNIHLTCCSCRKVPSCSYWMIWPSGIWETKQQSDLHGYTSNLSCDTTSWGKTDLYVAAIRYHNILMRGQVGHSFLWNDVLDLALQKRQYSRSKKHLFSSEVHFLVWAYTVESDLSY